MAGSPRVGLSERDPPTSGECSRSAYNFYANSGAVYYALAVMLRPMLPGAKLKNLSLKTRIFISSSPSFISNRAPPTQNANTVPR